MAFIVHFVETVITTEWLLNDLIISSVVKQFLCEAAV
jgi:hypothetical protein